MLAHYFTEEQSSHEPAKLPENIDKNRDDKVLPGKVFNVSRIFLSLDMLFSLDVMDKLVYIKGNFVTL